MSGADFMVVGIDFDNTLVCYDHVFGRVALEKGLVPPEYAFSKLSVRDFLRASGREPEWTELQGLVYGPAILQAEPFPGALDMIARCLDQGHSVRIISHKTRFPFAGPQHDLHQAARTWLAHYGLSPEARHQNLAVYLETELNGKLDRIAASGCHVFVDDLPEVLLHPRFPAVVQRILFDSGQCHGEGNYLRVVAWSEIAPLLEGVALNQ